MIIEVRTTINWQGIIKTGFAYGGGLMGGSIISQLLLNAINPEFYGSLDEKTRLTIGIALVILITAFGGAIGGFLGGWTLPTSGDTKGKYGFAWRSAISMGVAYGIFLFLIIFGLSMLALRAASFIPIGPFMQAYLFVGMLMGALIGLLLGLLTVGWRCIRSVIIAGTLGFGLGGAALGAGIWAYLESVPPGELHDGNPIFLLAGLFAFGLLGGLALGFAFDRLKRKKMGQERPPMRPLIRFVLYSLLGFFLLWLLIQLRPLISFTADMLVPRVAIQTETIAADSIGAHWQENTHWIARGNEVMTLDLSTGALDQTVLVWSERSVGATEVHFQVGQRGDDGELTWESDINVSNSMTESYEPHAVVDKEGAVHIVWLEGEAGIPHYSRCSENQCLDPQPITEAAPSCPSGNTSPEPPSIDIAAGSDGSLMVVWSDLAGGLQYRVLAEPGLLESTLTGSQQNCIPLPEGVTAGSFSLSSSPSAGFSLALDNGQDTIWMSEYKSKRWDLTAVELGSGIWPDLLVDENGSKLVVWCERDGGLAFWSGGQTGLLSPLSCLNNPAATIDSTGRTHVTWQSNQVMDVLGEVRQDDVLYELISDGESWTAPGIVARLETSTDHSIATDQAGNLHLAWTGTNPALHYAQQKIYRCDSQRLSGPEAEIYQVARLGGYRPEEDVIPFCQNHYEKIIFTPSVKPEFSNSEPTLNGGYDDYVKLIQAADYEVLFTTMFYTKAVNQDSPGAVLAKGIVDLYEQVKANPQDYPRGMLVRILLGNSLIPSFELLELDGGLWFVLNDLKEAGLEKMVDPEIGWRVEVGNFAGRWPHSHVKSMIIDGETVVASGFNHEYKPLPKDHPSGLGLGDTDTGLVITGPVAQHSRRIFDQLWTGAIKRHCPDLDVSETVLRLTCSDSSGVSYHVPEVMRYSLANDEAIAFSMFRNQVYNEADQQLLAAFDAAEVSIDLAQAMFSMELICGLNHFYEVCDFGQSPPYMKALMEAAENGVNIRIVLTPYPTQHIENVITMEIFNKEAAKRGLTDQVEIRMFDDLLHTKSAFIDGEFVIIGSQNLHWSAFGADKGLIEYNLGISDPNAAEQYQRFFDYLWQRSPSRAERSKN